MTRVTNSRLRPPRFGDARSPSASRTTQGAQQSTMPRYLSQQIGSHWTGTTGDGSTRRRPGTCVHSACPSPPAPSLSNQSTCIALPPARLRLPPGGEAPLRRSRGRFVYLEVYFSRLACRSKRDARGGMIPLFIFRAASLRSSVRALLPPDTVQSCTCENDKTQQLFSLPPDTYRPPSLSDQIFLACRQDHKTHETPPPPHPLAGPEAYS